MHGLGISIQSGVQCFMILTRHPLSVRPQKATECRVTPSPSVPSSPSFPSLSVSLHCDECPFPSFARSRSYSRVHRCESREPFTQRPTHLAWISTIQFGKL